jgi:hypothetical protein
VEPMAKPACCVIPAGFFIFTSNVYSSAVDEGGQWIISTVNYKHHIFLFFLQIFVIHVMHFYLKGESDYEKQACF